MILIVKGMPYIASQKLFKVGRRMIEERCFPRFDGISMDRIG